MKKYRIQLNKTNTGVLCLVSIPKAIVESFNWDKGTEVTWEILGKDKLKLEKVKNDK